MGSALSNVASRSVSSASSAGSGVLSSVPYIGQVLGGVGSAVGSGASLGKTMVSTSATVVKLGGTVVSYSYDGVVLILAILICILGSFTFVLTAVFVLTSPLASLGATSQFSDDCAKALLSPMVNKQSSLYKYSFKFLAGLIRIPLLLLFVLFALVRSFLKRLPLITIFFVLTFLLLAMETQSAQIFDQFNRASSVAMRSVNVGTSVANVGADVVDTFQPMVNVQTSYSVQSSLQVINVLRTTTNGAGRRLFDITSTTNQLQAPIAALTSAQSVINAASLLIEGLFLEYVYPIITDILEVIEFFIVRVGCSLMSIECAALQIFQDFFLDFFDIVFSSGASVVCGTQSFTANFPCICHGNGYLSFQELGIYLHAPVCNSRRVLCETKSEACEYLDGKLLGCHVDAQRGCPITRRSMSSIGHVLNMEDLVVDDCFEISINSSSLFRACRGEWEHLGGEHPNAEQHLIHLFGTAPPLLGRRRRVTAVHPEIKTRHEAAEDVRTSLPGPLFTESNVACDLTRPATNAYEHFVDMACIGRTVFRDRLASRGSSPSAHHRKLETWFDTARLIRTRRMLKDELGDDPHAWRIITESTALSDRVPLFENMRRLAASVEAISTLPDTWNKLRKDHLKRERLRRALSVAGTCPANFQACPDQSCVPIGQLDTCPPGCPGTYGAISCALDTADQAVQNFDLSQAYDDFETCWNNYAFQPATDPFGSEANSHPETVVYCFPMRRNIGYRFPVLDYNLQQLALTACESGDTAVCDCPTYYGGDFNYDAYWFSVVTVSELDRILNGLIALQWMVSRLVLSTVVLSWIDVVWYAFWSIFNLPIWWTHMFGNIYPVYNDQQQWLCFGLHTGDLFYLMLLVLLTLVFCEAFWPFIMLIGDLLAMPFEYAAYKMRMEKRVDFLSSYLYMRARNRAIAKAKLDKVWDNSISKSTVDAAVDPATDMAMQQAALTAADASVSLSISMEEMMDAKIRDALHKLNLPGA